MEALWDQVNDFDYNTNFWTFEMKYPATEARGLKLRRSPTYILGFYSVTADTTKQDKISDRRLGKGVDG